jgi:serine/threonine protein kinase
MAEFDSDPPTEGEPALHDGARSPDSQRLFVGTGARPDEYELVDKGRRGGEGSVFRARYRGTLPRSVDFALKQLMVPPGCDAAQWPDPGLVDRWREQLKLLHLVQNDHLVAYRELFFGWPPHPAMSCRGNPPEGLATWYLLMDWVDGPSLHELVRKGGATLSERVGYLGELAQAIELLHSGSTTGGMVLLHRDIKPSNVIIDPHRGAVLVDYGLLRVEEPILTEIPAWTGPYLAPEVHKDKTRTSRASDMWALAATAFFALTGEHPSPDEPDRMRDQLIEHLSGRVDHPEAVTDVVMSALGSLPDQRPTSPVAWTKRLTWSLGESVDPEAHLRGATVPLTPGDTHSRGLTDGHEIPPEPRLGARDTDRNHRRVWLGMLGALVLLAAAGIGLGHALTGASDRSGPPTGKSKSSRAATSIGSSTTNPHSNGSNDSNAKSGSSSGTVISMNESLSSDLSCSNLTIEPGVTLTTNGFNIYCSGSFDNRGTIISGPSPSRNFPSSYGGSGAGSTNLGGSANPGYATRSQGGVPCSTSGCTATNGSSAAPPAFSEAELQTWYGAGMNQYLAGAGGGSSPVAQGGAGANGLFVEANSIIAGTIVAAGSDGQNVPGQSTAGGGGGGVIVLAYVSSLTPGNYSTTPGYTITADGSHNEFGGNGAVVTQQFSTLPVKA